MSHKINPFLLLFFFPSLLSPLSFSPLPPSPSGSAGAQVLFSGPASRWHNYITVEPPRVEGGGVVNLVARITTEAGATATAGREVAFNVDVGGIVEGVIIGAVILLAVGVGYEGLLGGGRGDGEEDEEVEFEKGGGGLLGRGGGGGGGGRGRRR